MDLFIMDVLKDHMSHMWHLYERALASSDERVANWPLMHAYYPTITLTFAYLIVVYYGQKFMKNREPVNLKWTLFLYNMALVALNFHICSELFLSAWKLNYSYSCQLVSYTENPDEMRIAKALWWYYISKMVEFLDTIFFVARKKNNQISFLHVYHHASMFPIWWIGVKWVAGGQSFFGAMVNSFIHVLMYTYYGIAALGPQYQKYLWWKKYLTRIQLVQFVVGMVHAAQSIVVGCRFPLWMQWALIVYGITILSLFLNFYFHAYVKPKESRRSKNHVGDTAANGHPHTNGYIKRKTKAE